MVKKLFGRQKEKAVLLKALESEEAEMISIIGRRRVGKTYLVDTVYAERIVYKITGTKEHSKEDELRGFAQALTTYSKSPINFLAPKDWLEAFMILTDYLETRIGKEKIVVFFDEVPWLSSHKSGFLSALSWFWNSWAVQKNIVVVLCGSAASWIIRNIVNNRGGLHNRITRRLHLIPFTLAETEAYLKYKNVTLDRYQIVQLYMAMGGIPHYLKEVEDGLSAIQNINQICFGRTGLLRDEFPRLYVSLFDKADFHINVIKQLAKKRQGMTRGQIRDLIGASEGGRMTTVLEELEISGFITSLRPFGKKNRNRLYRLTDEYSIFYLDFIKDEDHDGEDVWHHLSQTATYKSWAGFAFENICIKHISQIKKAMSIAGIYSKSGSFYKKGDKENKGGQIDLVIDRNDHVVNLFEIKFYNQTYKMTKTYAMKLREKMELFRTTTNTKKQLFWVFITAFGLDKNPHSGGVVSKSLTMDDLFND